MVVNIENLYSNNKGEFNLWCSDSVKYYTITKKYMPRRMFNVMGNTDRSIISYKE